MRMRWGGVFALGLILLQGNSLFAATSADQISIPLSWSERQLEFRTDASGKTQVLLDGALSGRLLEAPRRSQDEGPPGRHREATQRSPGDAGRTKDRDLVVTSRARGLPILDRYGYDTFFRDRFAPFAEQGLSAGRVVSEVGPLFRVIG